MPSRDPLVELRGLISTHARPDLATSIEGLRLSSVESGEEHHALAEPTLVVMAQGGKRLFHGDHVVEYGAGDSLIVATTLPLTGHFVDIAPGVPALAMGMSLRPTAIASLLLEAPVESTTRVASGPAVAAGPAGPELLDAVLRLLRLLDRPGDRAVLAPMLEREILWRLLTGPDGSVVRQIGIADSSLTHVAIAIDWIREHYSEPMRVADLAARAGMSSSTFHRQFRAAVAMSPLQFQKRIRLQHARSMLLADPSDVSAVGHCVGYESATQFNREYRRLFGSPPRRDGERLRARGGVSPEGLPATG